VGTALDDLVDLLDLEQIEVNIFRGRSPDEQRQRVFGGQVAGQALVAAGRTVAPDRHVHSLHAYFLRPGDPKVPILYEVDRIRDGRSFTTRRVVAVQHGKAIFNLSASFKILEDGIDHQASMPAAPAPETLPTIGERMAVAGLADADDEFWARRPIDIRWTDTPPWLQPKGQRTADGQMTWIRADGNLPDDPLLHVCLMTYASDMSLLDSVLAVHGLSWNDEGVQGASLDHAMWFHRPFRADEWLLYVQESPTSAAACGLARGDVWTRDGRHVVSVVQEGLLRVLDTPENLHQ
jgi:acyl-CoA thioesterase-2